MFPRSDKGTELLAKHVHKWQVPEVRDIMGGASVPVSDPQPDVTDEPDHEPAGDELTDEQRTHKELFG